MWACKPSALHLTILNACSIDGSGGHSADLVERVSAALGSHGVVVVERLVSPMLAAAAVRELTGKGKFYGQPGSFARDDTSRNAGKPLGGETFARLTRRLTCSVSLLPFR